MTLKNEAIWLTKRNVQLVLNVRRDALASLFKVPYMAAPGSKQRPIRRRREDGRLLPVGWQVADSRQVSAKCDPCSPIWSIFNLEIWK